MADDQDDEQSRVRHEFEHFVCNWDHEAFVSSCRKSCLGLVEDIRGGARFIAEEAKTALANRRPLSMVRIGDGEGNLLRFGEHQDNFELKWANAIFAIHDHQSLSAEQAAIFASEMTEAIAVADIVGLRAFGANSPQIQITKIREVLERGDFRGALGMIGALVYAATAVKKGAFENTVLTSAWVHLGLLEQLDDLLQEAQQVVVITGRHELQNIFISQLKERLAAFLPIPIQASDGLLTGRQFHYPIRYHQIIKSLQMDLRGVLVLIGAGLFGKRYCAIAKKHGGVALDLGSAFDILAGKRTRPVHNRLESLNIKYTPWIR
jgi:hypothetical protein